MHRNLAVFSAFLIISVTTGAWSKKRDAPRYEPPVFEELPGTGLPETAPTQPPPVASRESVSEPVAVTHTLALPGTTGNEELPPPLEEPPANAPLAAPAPTAETHEASSAPVPDLTPVTVVEPAAPPLAESSSVASDVPDLTPVIPDSNTHAAPEPDQPATPVKATPAVPRAVPKMKNYRVWIWQENGDTLARIAKKVYGDASKWRLIYLANRDKIKNPNRIFPKQKLIIPPPDWQP